MPPQGLAVAATLLSFIPHGNRIELKLDRGAAEVVWISPSTFHFRRVLQGELPAQSTRNPEPALKVESSDTPDGLRMRTDDLEVAIDKRALLVHARKRNGSPLMTDLSEPKRSGRDFIWERQAAPADRFYGLGPRTEPVLNLRGKSIVTTEPFLISTAGYGEYYPTAGTYEFDLWPADRYWIHAPAIDYYFYYGPAPKQVFDEHHAAPAPWSPSTDGVASWDGLRSLLLRLVHGAMSAKLAPVLNLTAYTNAPTELQQRARQIGSLVDDISPGKVTLSGFRKQLEGFFTTYSAELHDRGFPVWHPLPLEFPEDPECALHADEFMLGDEMLIAPIYEPGGKRSLYLPQGVWTNLETNEVFPGRRTVTVETTALPVFARNGSIVPLDSEGGVALHYFPKLAAEFFLFETDQQEWTLIHAAPAGDIIRLQIEAKAKHDYQWVVHHADRPASVGFGDVKYKQSPSLAELHNRSWFYDAAQKNLHVRTTVNTGEDRIINIEFP
jgi:hypothetical protein